MQSVKVGGHSFLHLHLPNDYRHNRQTIQDVIIPHIVTSLPSLPFLVGDFNSVILPDDAEANFANRYNPRLAALVAAYQYGDAYTLLHPLPAFTFHKKNFSSSRLDRAYVPPTLCGRVKVVRHVPGLSDHQALLVQLEGSLLDVVRPPPAARASYWVANASIFSEPDFLPTFCRMWAGLVQSRPPAADPALWWEETAKPACRAACQAFSKLVAHRRRETVYLSLCALQIALEARDWAAVATLRSRLRESEALRRRGAQIRSRRAFLAGDEDDLFAAAAEAARPHTPLRVRADDGRILTDQDEVEVVITDYFQALFHGRHVATADRPEPHDSGRPFVPDFAEFRYFTRALPSLDGFQRESLELPFNLPELTAAVAGAAGGRSPGLDGLTYEFYSAVLPVIGVQLLEALNVMLEQGRLTPSLRQGVVRLIPKVAGVPTAAQFRPITLLACDYKLLTKMFVNRLLVVLPTILVTGQLCSVRGRSIHDGILQLSSVVEALRRRRRPGFLLNLDLFHAYDRVCLSYVDRVLAVMNFGPTFRDWVAALHRDAAASFLLHRITPSFPITFSIRQGDPLAMLLFNIQLEPLLSTLHRILPGVPIGNATEAVLAYVDDVDVVGTTEVELLLVDDTVAAFEAMSGAILNRTRKSAILGLGTWSGRRDWPLPWLAAPPTLKVFGVTFNTSYQLTVAASWADTVQRALAALTEWTRRHLPTIRLRRDALEVFVFSRLWFLAQAFTLPQRVARDVTTAAGTFLWRGLGFGLERLAWQELHRPLAEGGLAVSCIFSRGQALLAKQMCWMVGQGGPPADHLAFWLGGQLADLLPELEPPPGAVIFQPPIYLQSVVPLLREVLTYGPVDPAALPYASAKEIYATFMDSTPPPKIESRFPLLPWPTVWARLWRPGIPAVEADLAFRAIHSILPLRARTGHFDRAGGGQDCRLCPGRPETVLHFFALCDRAAEVWPRLYRYLAAAIPVIPTDQELLLLAFEPGPRDDDISAVVIAYLSFWWAGRGPAAAPTWDAFVATLRGRPGLSNFW